MKLLAPALLLAVLPVYGTQAESLGRLFFTPEQRAQLELRNMREATEDKAISAPTLNGVVQKNGGPRTVWINDVPQNSDGGNGYAPDSEIIPVHGDTRPVKLKVGQHYMPEPEPGE